MQEVEQRRERLPRRIKCSSYFIRVPTSLVVPRLFLLALILFRFNGYFISDINPALYDLQYNPIKNHRQAAFFFTKKLLLRNLAAIEAVCDY